MVALEKVRGLYEKCRASRKLQHLKTQANSIIYTPELLTLPDTMTIEFSESSAKLRTGNSSGVGDVSIFIIPGIADVIVSVRSIY